jgi:4-diphosphocytidyl-2-C-methyl-D-erythritol kinase
VLVNPGVALTTKTVFVRWTAPAVAVATLDADAVAKFEEHDALLRLLTTQANDLEAPAITLAPVIADVLAALRALTGCSLARMSGSGATCFALFASAAAAQEAAKGLHGKYPQWWVQACVLG